VQTTTLISLAGRLNLHTFPSDILPSSTAANPSYLYPVPPPPAAQSTSSTSRNRAPPPAGHHSPSSSTSRQPRINQLLEDDPPLSSTSLPYLSPTQNQLSRSASLGASTASASARTRRHHMPDDLEGAYGTTNASPAVHQRQHSNSFYNSSVAYQTSSFGANSSDSNPNSQPAASDATYQDMYFSTPGAQPPKRSHTQHDSSTAARVARSPLRANANSSLLDPYAQQSQYSPTSASYNYQSPSFHARSHSQTKVEVVTPPISSPYSQPNSAPIPPPPIYSPSYAMDTGSPHLPPSALLTQPLKQSASISTPSTPIGFPVPQQHSPAPTGPYYPQSQDQPMMVDPLRSDVRLASGVCVINAICVLKSGPDLRRDAWTRLARFYLYVLTNSTSPLSWSPFSPCVVALASVDNVHHRYLPHMQSPVQV
jgi:dual specificity protein kinase YAK1